MWVHVQTNPYISIFGFCMSIYIHSYIVLHIYIYMHRQSHTYIPSNPIVLYIYYILMSWFVFYPPYTLMVSMMVGQSPSKKNKVKSSSGAEILSLYLGYIWIISPLWLVTLWLCQTVCELEAMAHRKFVDLPSYKMVDLSHQFFVCLPGRVNPIKSH